MSLRPSNDTLLDILIVLTLPLWGWPVLIWLCFQPTEYQP